MSNARNLLNALGADNGGAIGRAVRSTKWALRYASMSNLEDLPNALGADNGGAIGGAVGLTNWELRNAS